MATDPTPKQPPAKKEAAAKPEEEKKKTGAFTFTPAVAAVVEEVVGRTGTRGGIIQVRAKILDGPDKNKVLRRNVKGPIRERDVIMLRETEIEARSLTQGNRGRK